MLSKIYKIQNQQFQIVKCFKEVRKLRGLDFESAGRPFEPGRARHKIRDFFFIRPLNLSN
jgi:hypothetical protein